MFALWFVTFLGGTACAAGVIFSFNLFDVATRLADWLSRRLLTDSQQLTLDHGASYFRWFGVFLLSGGSWLIALFIARMAGVSVYIASAALLLFAFMGHVVATFKYRFAPGPSRRERRYLMIIQIPILSLGVFTFAGLALLGAITDPG